MLTRHTLALNPAAAAEPLPDRSGAGSCRAHCALAPQAWALAGAALAGARWRRRALPGVIFLNECVYTGGSNESGAAIITALSAVYRIDSRVSRTGRLYTRSRKGSRCVAVAEEECKNRVWNEIAICVSEMASIIHNPLIASEPQTNWSPSACCVSVV